MKTKPRILLTAGLCLLAAEAPKTSSPTAPAPAKKGTIGGTLQNEFFH